MDRIFNAIQSNDLETIKSLLNYTNVNLKLKGIAPIHLATFLNKIEILRYILNINNVNINLKGRTLEGKLTASFIAVRKNKIKCLELLLQKNADVGLNFNPIPLIHLAASLSNKKAFDLLIDKSDINILDKNGNSTLHKVIKTSSYYYITELVRRNANINIQNNLGYTPALLCCKFGKILHLEYLISTRKCNLNLKTIQGSNGLHIASKYGKDQIIKILLRNGLDINQVDNFGKNSLHIAAKFGRYFAAQILIENGININHLDNQNRTALHLSSQYKYPEMFQIILDSGININSQNLDGDTATHITARIGDIKGIKILLQNNPNLNILNYQGKTILDVASNNVKSIILEYIRSIEKSEVDLLNISSTKSNDNSPTYLAFGIKDLTDKIKENLG